MFRMCPSHPASSLALSCRAPWPNPTGRPAEGALLDCSRAQCPVTEVDGHSELVHGVAPPLLAHIKVDESSAALGIDLEHTLVRSLRTGHVPLGDTSVSKESWALC